jgi:hypothetical protein
LDSSSDDEEDDNNEENDGGAAVDDTNEQIMVPITDQDQRGANVSCPLDPAPPLVIFVYNTVTDKCQLNIDPSVIVNPACENAKIGGELNTEIDQCVASRDPICEVGTFNPETDQCEQRQTQPPT